MIGSKSVLARNQGLVREKRTAWKKKKKKKNTHTLRGDLGKEPITFGKRMIVEMILKRQTSTQSND